MNSIIKLVKKYPKASATFLFISAVLLVPKLQVPATKKEQTNNNTVAAAVLNNQTTSSNTSVSSTSITPSSQNEQPKEVTKSTTSVAPAPAPITPQAVVPTYSCDCSKTCEQISSCAEAQYQLNVCGCTRRDSDKDGIACDSGPLNCQ